jgi:septum formation inhibitor-activating ATPase MinD
MKTINHSTSAYLVYELKGFSFLIYECYGNTDTGSYNTPYNNNKQVVTTTPNITSSPPTHTRNLGKVQKFIQEIEEYKLKSN